jgi:hypothetical protein
MAFPGLPDLGRVWQDLDHLPAWWVFEQRGKAKLVFVSLMAAGKPPCCPSAGFQLML